MTVCDSTDFSAADETKFQPTLTYTHKHIHSTCTHKHTHILVHTYYDFLKSRETPSPLGRFLKNCARTIARSYVNLYIAG